MLVWTLIAAWTADVDYKLSDKNGMGWVNVEGQSTVTFTLKELRITGKSKGVDALLTDGPREMKTTPFEGKHDDTYPLVEVVRTGDALAFKLGTIVASCAPIKVEGLERSDLIECRFTGIQWRANPSLPELHHPLIFGSTGPRIVNTFDGSSKPDFATRKVTERK